MSHCERETPPLVRRIATLLLMATIVGCAGVQGQAAPGSTAASTTTKMTNADVIKLVAAGISDQVIISAIQAASSREFDVTPTGLIGLKNAKVPDAVIGAMQSAPPSAGTRPAARSPVSDTKSANPRTIGELTSALDRGDTIHFFVADKLKEPSHHQLALAKGSVIYGPKGGPAVFAVAPSQIIELAYQPTDYRIHLKVQLRNLKTGKDENKTFDIYHPGAWFMSSVFCTNCDNSMEVLYELLEGLRTGR